MTHGHYPINPGLGDTISGGTWGDDINEAIWQPYAQGGYWSGVLGTPGVEFKVEIALGSADGQGGSTYDNPASVYDEATYSTSDLYWVDLTPRVIEVNGGRGRGRLDENFRAGQGSLTLDNQDGLFNPQQGINLIGDQAMRPGRWVKLSGRRTGTATWIPLWVMRVQALADEYIDAAHRILSRWSLTGLETVLQQRSYVAQSPGSSEGWTFDQVARDYWTEVLDVPDGLLITPDTYHHPLIADDYEGTAYQLLQKWAKAEGGDFYVAKDGYFYARGRDWLDLDAPPLFQIGAYDLAPVVVIGAKTAWDMTRIINQARFTGEPYEFDAGDPPALIDRQTQTANSSSSQALYGLSVVETDGLWCAEDTDVNFLANRAIENFAYDSLRIDSLDVWSPTLDGVDLLLDLELGDMVQTQIVTAAGWDYALRTLVNGVQHSVTADDWLVTIQLDNAFRGDPRQSGPYTSAYSAAYNRQEA